MWLQHPGFSIGGALGVICTRTCTHTRRHPSQRVLVTLCLGEVQESPFPSSTSVFGNLSGAWCRPVSEVVIRLAPAQVAPSLLSLALMWEGRGSAHGAQAAAHTSCPSPLRVCLTRFIFSCDDKVTGAASVSVGINCALRSQRTSGRGRERRC